MSSLISGLYQYFDSLSTLIIAALGLAIIFGMMGIINFAHGEFIMLGAVTAATLNFYHVPFFLNIIISACFIGLFGFAMDRLIIRHLYKRVLDSVVATWGISMILKQAVVIWAQKKYGGAIPGIRAPFGSVKLADVSLSLYKIFLMLLAVVLLVAVYITFQHTKFGLKSRATMQSPDIAVSLGINTSMKYGLTFGIGSFLAGLAGALFAPLMTVTADFGSTYMLPSFITVLVGGANPLIGTAIASLVLAGVKTGISLKFNSLFGDIIMLLFSIVFIRFCPKGFSSMVDRIVQNHARRKAKANK